MYATTVVAVDLSVPGCGNLSNAYGPWDYTNPDHFQEKLPIVTIAHFTTSVENLTKGKSGTILGDLDYTLRAFPNHHRALYAMARYQLRYPNQINRQTRYRTAECYFKRAMAFKPDDGKVLMLYGIYEYKRERLDHAEELYFKALEHIPENPDLQNNIALLFLKKSDYEKAKIHAEKAYQYGFPFRGVEKILKNKNKW